MKIISFDGRVGANGTEVKMTKNGRQYARFSVANNSFINGEEKTEWFDVITYDQNFIEKRAQYLTKGSYVIINGHLKTEVNVDQSNKVWINHHVTASTIDTPRFGTKNEQQTVQTQFTHLCEVFRCRTLGEAYFLCDFRLIRRSTVFQVEAFRILLNIRHNVKAL